MTRETTLDSKSGRAARSAQHDVNPQPTPISPSHIIIGDHKIGSGLPVYIIAEAGVNHDGDPDRAHALIEAAANAGADAVKFQHFAADRLVAPGAPTCTYQRDHDTAAVHQHAMLNRLELPAEAFHPLKQHAGEKGLDFLATPFGTAELAFLVDKLHVPAMKIASSDLINEPLLTRAVRSGLPIIVSTGASVLEEVDRAIACVQKHGGSKRLILLHCVSSYPTRLEAARLRCIATLKQRYGFPVGFSDHTEETETGGHAVMAGAVIVEKHLTLDRNTPGPDHFFSLEPDAFAEYVRYVRVAERVLGDGKIAYAPDEEEVRKLARGRIVTAKAIPAGQRLTEDVLMVQRPGDGISPAQWGEVIGHVINRDLPANAPLDWSLLA